ncbi:hypothetical protein OD350_28855 (plasmid) [Clostridium beijerinckii]|uniref:hypothetical protein n=1 Tax=Clostridium beijerinckii TaxID=1520 RepID=UPI0022265C68|nr:hypothetical protein [Clostridium beijerinckii]UYZ39085.1 hypothetical protein OD350_28855 [Clostridium beijerinckii]
MGKLYVNYEKLKLDSSLENNMRLIYILAAIEAELDFIFSIKKEHGFNQFRLYATAKGSKGEHDILLQATQWNNGRIDLSIQGLASIEDIKNFVDYANKDEHDIFMKYLKYF